MICQIPYKSFFVENYDISARLKSGVVVKAIITDGSLTIHRKNNIDIEFGLPSEYNFNLHKEILSERDNIRIFEIMLIDSSVERIEDIECIIFEFKNSECKKRIVLNAKAFPDFNKARFLSEFEHILDEKKCIGVPVR